jgi:regulator of sirC expression with transglutaminase-like and TPR domain
MSRLDLEEKLTSLGRLADDEIELAETALTLALLDRLAADPAPYRDALLLLVHDVRNLFAGMGAARDFTPATARAMALSGVIAEKHGYEGDRASYDDLDNADFIRVLERRRGLPVALAILYIHVGRAQGWEIYGLNIPGHFIVEVKAGEERAALDPFNHGRLLSESDVTALIAHILGKGVQIDAAHLMRATNRDIILRLENNLAGRAMRAGDRGRALTIISRMLMLAPRHAGLWREYAMMQIMQGHVGDARRALETCIVEARKLGDNLLAEEARETLARLTSDSR